MWLTANCPFSNLPFSGSFVWPPRLQPLCFQLYTLCFNSLFTLLSGCLHPKRKAILKDMIASYLLSLFSTVLDKMLISQWKLNEWMSKFFTKGHIWSTWTLGVTSGKKSAGCQRERDGQAVPPHVGSFQSRDWTRVSCGSYAACGFFISEPLEAALESGDLGSDPNSASFWLV